jgi:hypothetical protein
MGGPNIGGSGVGTTGMTTGCGPNMGNSITGGFVPTETALAPDIIPMANNNTLITKNICSFILVKPQLIKSFSFIMKT